MKSTRRNDGVALVLDGNQRSALAVVRSLGGRGIAVHAADASDGSLAGSSAFSAGHLPCPSPADAPSRFADWVSETARWLRADVVFAMTELTSRTLLAVDDPHLRPKLPLPDPKLSDRLADKGELVAQARDLGIPCPASVRFDHGRDIRGCDVVFPAVLKPVRSHFRVDGRWRPSRVRVVRHAGELARALERDETLADFPVVLQEYVPGHGAGVFALYDRGKPLAFFGHRRLREKPPGGGVSVLSESVPLDPHLRAYAERLLGDGGWHGVAMVEFRIDPEGRAHLMEVNTRLWGSLQLAVDCGVDFPWMLWQLTTGAEVRPVHGYRVGRRLRWVLGDVDSLYLALRSTEGSALREGWVRIAEFLTPDPRRTRHEVNRWGDLGPARFELREYLRQLRGG